MKLDYEDLRAALTRAMAMALEVYEENKANGSTIQSVSFDSGRYDGLKQSIEILDQMAR